MEPDARDRTPLFRQVAIDAASGSQLGVTLATHWRGVRIFTMAAFCLVAGLVLFLALVDYAPSLHVNAYTDSRIGLVRLKAPVDGRVALIDVKEGQAVQQGDVIAVISRDKVQANGASQHAALRASLDQERHLVDGQVDSARQEAEETRAMIERRIDGLRLEREALEADLKATEQMLASLQVQSERFGALVAQGFVSELQSAQKRDEATLQQSRVANARAALVRITRDIRMAEEERALVGTKLTQAVGDRRRRSIELDRLAARVTLTLAKNRPRAVGRHGVLGHDRAGRVGAGRGGDVHVLPASPRRRALAGAGARRRVGAGGTPIRMVSGVSRGEIRVVDRDRRDRQLERRDAEDVPHAAAGPGRFPVRWRSWPAPAARRDGAVLLAEAGTRGRHHRAG